MKNIKLNNGLLMPCVGIGTFLLSPEEAENSVCQALKNGYRLIDTANAYMNERVVGKAIKKSGINRDEIFVSTKLWCSEYDNPNAVDETLERLGLDYIDLLFIHQPTSNWRKGYNQLIKAYKDDKIKSIGVSNFEGKYIKELLEEFDIIPQVHQVECHPFFPQTELRKVLADNDIKIMSWYPLGGRGATQELLTSPIIVSIAKKYNKTPAQVVLKWHTQMGFIVIPGSKNVEHIKANIDLFDFTLTREDMNNIAKLNNGQRRYNGTEKDLAHFQNWKPQFEKK